MSLTYGSLFAGYNGLGMGVQSVLGGTTSWFVEFEAAPSKILAHHYPGVPNLGDATKVDWHSVPKVNVIEGGSPCQDLSHAGKRAGMKAGTRSGLWASMCDAIEIIRPSLVVWENVRGALSAEADSEMEQCPGCVGDPDDGPVLRALGRVLGDLADLGYDASWYGLRAADVGAPHGRFRIFVFATDTEGDQGWIGNRDGGDAADTERDRRQERRPIELGAAQSRAGVDRRAVGDPKNIGHKWAGSPWRGWDGSADSGQPATDTNSAGRLEYGRPESAGQEQPAAEHHCDAPTDTEGNEQREPADAAGWRSGLRTEPRDGSNTPADAGGQRHGRGQDGRALGRVDGCDAGKTRQRERSWEVVGDRDAEAPADPNRDGLEKVGRLEPIGCHADGRSGADIAWGQYEPAIRRWGHILGRPAPAPTEPGPKGGQRLSPAFVEWLMGLPEGHVTDPAIWTKAIPTRTPGVNVQGVPTSARNDMLKALGNGVVPQQAAAATRAWLAHIESERVA